MRVYQINVTARFSTGTIAKNIHNALKARGDSSRFAFGYGGECEQDFYQITNIWGLRADAKWMQLTGCEGHLAYLSTKRLVEDIRKFDPDIVHLHNVHGNYLYLPVLLRSLKQLDKPVVFTLHDCWAFTGGCYHFYTNRCTKWKNICQDCQYSRRFLLDKLYKTEKANFENKKEMLNSIGNLTITTVSDWLQSVTKESFLGAREIHSVPNGIDTLVFRRKNVEPLREKLGCQNKIVLLGVASTWSERKGFNKWIQLAENIDDDYQVVLVGLSEKQKDLLPPNVIGLGRVKDTEELVELYNLAEIYINLSEEETFGLPTAEAMACGTPVIVLNATANPELVGEQVGLIAEDDSVESICKCIAELKSKGKINMSEACIGKVHERYSVERMTSQYLQIYDALYSRGEI